MGHGAQHHDRGQESNGLREDEVRCGPEGQGHGSAHGDPVHPGLEGAGPALHHGGPEKEGHEDDAGVAYQAQRGRAGDPHVHSVQGEDPRGDLRPRRETLRQRGRVCGPVGR